MSRVVKHVLLPAIAPLAIVALYFTPVTVFGCANRGLAAFGIAIVAGLAGIVTGVLGIRARLQRESDSGWWMVTTLVLAMPAVLLLGPLG